MNENKLCKSIINDIVLTRSMKIFRNGIERLREFSVVPVSPADIQRIVDVAIIFLRDSERVRELLRTVKFTALDAEDVTMSEIAGMEYGLIRLYYDKKVEMANGNVEYELLLTEHFDTEYFFNVMRKQEQWSDALNAVWTCDAGRVLHLNPTSKSKYISFDSDNEYIEHLFEIALSKSVVQQA